MLKGILTKAEKRLLKKAEAVLKVRKITEERKVFGMKKGDLIGVVGKCSKGSRVVINREILKTKAGKVQMLSQHGRLIWLKRDSKLITEVKAEPDINFEESLEELRRAFAAGSNYSRERIENALI